MVNVSPAWSHPAVELDLIHSPQSLRASPSPNWPEGVSLSTPAVIERVKRLEEGGVIVGYHAHIKPSAVSRSVEAFYQRQRCRR